MNTQDIYLLSKFQGLLIFFTNLRFEGQNGQLLGRSENIPERRTDQKRWGIPVRTSHCIPMKLNPEAQRFLSSHGHYCLYYRLYRGGRENHKATCFVSHRTSLNLAVSNCIKSLALMHLFCPTLWWKIQFTYHTKAIWLMLYGILLLWKRSETKNILKHTFTYKNRRAVLLNKIANLQQMPKQLSLKSNIIKNS